MCGCEVPSSMSRVDEPEPEDVERQVETQVRKKSAVKECEHEWEPVPAVKCEHCGMIIED